MSSNSNCPFTSFASSAITLMAADTVCELASGAMSVQLRAPTICDSVHSSSPYGGMTGRVVSSVLRA
jgi:hypothetical protein